MAPTLRSSTRGTITPAVPAVLAIPAAPAVPTAPRRSSRIQTAQKSSSASITPGLPPVTRKPRRAKTQEAKEKPAGPAAAAAPEAPRFFLESVTIDNRAPLRQGPEPEMNSPATTQVGNNIEVIDLTGNYGDKEGAGQEHDEQGYVDNTWIEILEGLFLFFAWLFVKLLLRV